MATPENESLLEELAQRQIPLELCPTSNLQTKAVPDLAHFPLREYLRRGLRATVNTDNMTVSRTTLSQEYALLGLTGEERRALLRNSVEPPSCQRRTSAPCGSRWRPACNTSMEKGPGPQSRPFLQLFGESVQDHQVPDVLDGVLQSLLSLVAPPGGGVGSMAR